MTRAEIARALLRKPEYDSQIGLVAWCQWMATRIMTGVSSDDECGWVESMINDGLDLENIGIKILGREYTQ